MWKRFNFETIFTSNYVMNIQDTIGKGFGSQERAYSMGLNDCFGHRITNRTHATLNYGHGKSKFEIVYYRQTYFFPEKLAHI